jgi:hypothetical protein
VLGCAVQDKAIEELVRVPTVSAVGAVGRAAAPGAVVTVREGLKCRPPLQSRRATWKVWVEADGSPPIRALSNVVGGCGAPST